MIVRPPSDGQESWWGVGVIHSSFYDAPQRKLQQVNMFGISVRDYKNFFRVYHSRLRHSPNSIHR
jgi:hypothetical protein